MTGRKPETLGQARVWETIKTQYIGQGLCHRCAALAAWGHQTGMSLIDPPCAACRPVVARFPNPGGPEWRKASRDMLRGDSALSPAVAVAPGAKDADDNIAARNALPVLNPGSPGGSTGPKRLRQGQRIGPLIVLGEHGRTKRRRRGGRRVIWHLRDENTGSDTFRTTAQVIALDRAAKAAEAIAE